MISKRQAAEILARHLGQEYPHRHGDSRIVVNDDALECEHGWIFGYTTAAFHRTRDPRHALIGAGPVLVLRKNGKIVEFTSAFSKERAIAEYEADPTRFRAH